MGAKAARLECTHPLVSRGGPTEETMTGIICNPAEFTTYVPSGLAELVRGSEKDLLDRLAPLVERQSTTLDMRHIERIDAAGIAVLISLYGRAREAGYCFSVVNASPRVTEILALVGLDRILLSQNAVQTPHSGDRCECPAA